MSYRYAYAKIKLSGSKYSVNQRLPINQRYYEMCMKHCVFC